MVITNLKLFNKVCSKMSKICRYRKSKKTKQIFNDVFFMCNNFMCATDGIIIVIRNMNDCVINDEDFAFPCHIKPTKFVTSDGNKFIIKNRKEEWFKKDEKKISDFNWKKFIPTEKPITEKEYDFSDYKMTIPKAKLSVVTFCENENVIFNYNDYDDCVVTYSDVTRHDYTFEVNDKPIRMATIEMKYIYFILGISNNFLFQQFKNNNFIRMITKDYQFLINPLY